MSSQRIARIASLGALLIVVVAIAALLASGSTPYQVRAVFANVGGLVNGFRVRIDGAPVGTVSKLTLDSQDHVVATLDLDSSAAPVGLDATATVRAADLLGEKYIDLVPGNREQPAPSGTTIPLSRTGLAVELDDVLNSIDVPTQSALQVLLNEQGLAFAGQGQNLASVLATLPPSLDQTQQLLAQLGQNNAALGRLVDESDRTVSAVTAQRASLNNLVSSASGTLGILAGRRAELGQTVADAPATLASLRSALAALQNAALPLGPAAQGLAQTAPQLTATLEQLPGFTADASPTLAIVRDVSPTLTALGTRGTPVVKRLAPLTSELATFSTSLQPVGTTLDQGIGNVLGLMEGWSRATQGRDASGHVFRFGLTVSPATFSSLAPLLQTSARQRRQIAQRVVSAVFNAAPVASTPAAAPTLAPLKKLTTSLTNAVSTTVKSVVGTVTSTVDQALQKLGLGTPSPSAPPSSLQQLINYLLR